MTFDFIQDTARNELINITDTNTVISFSRTQANPRKCYTIRNMSGANVLITVNLGLSQARSYTGIVLKNGESFSDSSETGYTCFQGTINAVAEAEEEGADGYLTIMER